MDAKKGIGIAVAIVAVGILAVIAWPADDKSSQSSATNPGNMGSSSNMNMGESNMQSQSPSNGMVDSSYDPNNYTDGANIGETVDATSQSDVNVSINDFIFETTYLKISPGTTVTWTNDGRIRHDVQSASSSPRGGLESSLLSNGESYSYTFSEAGVYEYFCSPHPTQMRATIIVEES